MIIICNLSLIYFLTNDNIFFIEIINSNRVKFNFESLCGKRNESWRHNNEESIGEKYQFTNCLDIFYDNLFYYYKLKYGSNTDINKVYQLPDSINLSLVKILKF